MKKEIFRCCKLDRFFVGDIPVDEDIGTIYEVLDNDDRKFTLAEEVNCRLFGMQTILKDSYEKLLKRDEREAKNV
jgi:hypothetical protein